MGRAVACVYSRAEHRRVLGNLLPKLGNLLPKSSQEKEEMWQLILVAHKGQLHP